MTTKDPIGSTENSANKFEIQLCWMWCLATLSPSNGVTLVPDVRMWGEQTSAPSVQAVHQLCKGYLFQHSHAVHQSDLQYKNYTIYWAAKRRTIQSLFTRVSGQTLHIPSHACKLKHAPPTQNHGVVSEIRSFEDKVNKLDISAIVT